MQREELTDRQVFESCLIRATLACGRVRGTMAELQLVAPPKTETQVQAWQLLQLNFQSFTNLLTFIALECEGEEKTANSMDVKAPIVAGDLQ